MNFKSLGVGTRTTVSRRLDAQALRNVIRDINISYQDKGAQKVSINRGMHVMNIINSN